MQKISLSPAMPLSELNLPFLELVLEEMFFLTPRLFRPQTQNIPQTIAELCELSQLNYDEVCRSLREIMRQSEAIVIYPEDLPKLASYWIIDIRSPSKRLKDPSRAICPWEVVFHEWLAHYKNTELTRPLVVVSETSERAYSAAMALRQEGYAAACFLSGDLTADSLDDLS